MLKVPRHLLGFAAAARGLIAGPISFVEPQSLHHVDCMPAANITSAGTVAPDSGPSAAAAATTELVSDIRRAGIAGQPIEVMAHLVRNISSASARFVLVVEKEAVFQSLVARQFHLGSRNGIADGIIVTGKGFPDVMTASFVARLAHSLPTMLFTDADPAGFRIAMFYKHGCGDTRLTYGYPPSILEAPAAHWIGLLPSDITSGGHVRAAELHPLSLAELADLDTSIAKAAALGWTQAVDELQILKLLGKKAEIQALADQHDGAAPAAQTPLEALLSAKISAALNPPHHH
eukprot:comp5267_c0_seq1/m.4433 comp5267_c0_seq1/g.4433  ORF comp5267_c0_seq1/g.4433 comp5267_c0_seq1/m.4433 type:complete len:290 (-) comp5267_c0_seq1:65-934(-)